MNVDKMPENPEEIMTMGEMLGIEPPLTKAKEQVDEKVNGLKNVGTYQSTRSQRHYLGMGK